MGDQARRSARGVLFRFSGELIKLIEKAGSWFPTLGRAYGETFYSDLLEREMEMVSLCPGDNVLHIGCGALPLTALNLAEKGLKVTAVDIDPTAVLRAKRFLKQMGGEDAVEVRHADGGKMSANQFDAVWISLHVAPKREIVSNLLSNLRPGAHLVYRNPRGLLSLLYPRIRPESVAKGCHKRMEFILGKESIFVCKQEGGIECVE